MERRGFLKSLGVMAAAEVVGVSYCQDLWAYDLDRFRVNGLSILQGLTTETTTQLTVDLPVAMKVEYQLVDKQTKKVFSPGWIRQNAHSNSPMRVDRVFFEGLELGHEYQFFVTETLKNLILDERFLTTADLSKTNIRVGVMSCMNDGKIAKAKMWPAVQKANPDYIFFIGDSVYGDTLLEHGPDKLWARFLESRANIEFYKWKNLKPVISVWDDHDYGKNNADGNYQFKADTLRIFKSFYGQEGLGETLTNGPALSNCFEAFHQTFLFLDCRYYRCLPNGSISGFLGSEQMAWMDEVVKRATGPLWVIQGSPFYGRAEKSKTSYQAEAPEELEVFMKKVASYNRPTIFFGGDLHYAEVSRISRNVLGYETFEFISSCMHSSTKSAFLSNPNPRLGGYLKENFLLFEKQGAASDPSWKVACVGADSLVSFSGTYSL